MPLFADMTDFLETLDPQRPVSRAFVKMVSFLGTIVEAASFLEPGERASTVVSCRKRPNRRPCPGKVMVEVSSAESLIVWCCSECKDEGTIKNWQGTPWDRARRHATQKVSPAIDRVDLIITDQEYAELAALGHVQPVPESLFQEARRTPDGVMLTGSRTDMTALSWCLAQEQSPERIQARAEAMVDLDRRLGSALKRWN